MSQTLVQVNMSDDTLRKVENVRKRTHAETKTGAIRSSIAIADMITDALSRGGNVIIEEKSGNKFMIAIPGVNKDV